MSGECSRKVFNASSHKNIGMPLAGLGKLDNLLGNNAVGEIVGKPERYASHFERDRQNPLGFGIGIELV